MSMSLGLCGIYLTECSPKHCRGMIGMTTGIFVQLGLFTGSLVGMPDVFGTDETWWMIYLIEVLVVSVVMALFSFCRETPGFLIFKGYEEASRISVKFFYNCPDYQVDKHIKELRDNMSANSRSIGMIAALKNSKIRRSILVGVTVAFAMSFSGVAGRFNVLYFIVL